MMLIAVAALGVAELSGVAARSGEAARVQTSATLMASQKMEQLQSMTWRFDGLGLPESDTTTDVSRDPAASGSTGLGPSPAGALDANLPGYVDFLDRAGRWVGTGAVAPAGAAYVRRWSVAPLATDPSDAVVLSVIVRPVAPRLGVGRADAALTTVRTRKAP
jgi:hypothetical protein